jgi:hypothetical protein
MDHGGEALIGLVGSHGDAFEFFELAEEVFDEMPPFVHLLVDSERLCALNVLEAMPSPAARWRSSASASSQGELSAFSSYHFN